MAFDFKKAQKNLYLPKRSPEIVNVPPMTYVTVRGKGNPNEEAGAYKESIGILYAVAYTIKMSKMTSHKIEDYFDFVVPPLEGFWWQEDIDGIDFSRKDLFNWISAIRLPDFVTPEVFEWACDQATRKKDVDAGKAKLVSIDEGPCAQIMHIGPYDDEPATIERLDSFIASEGYEADSSSKESGRHHHEIYLSDPRRTAPEKQKTVIRHPIKKPQ